MAYISENKIQYTLSHLAHHWYEDDKIRSLFRFKDISKSNLEDHENSILFPLSDATEPEPVFIEVRKTRIPILFPIHSGEEAFRIDGAGNLIYSHDFIKSAFYFLSGQQELKTEERDFIGRYPYKKSIQSKLNCTHLPVVNYYFDLILQGLDFWCNHHGFKPVRRKQLFENFGFLLSHDVDRISFYHPREVLFKIKQLMGLSPLYYSKALTFKLFVKGILHNLNPFSTKDPWWNFDYLIELEKKMGIRSSFYFLRYEHRNMDSRYTFRKPKIKKLMRDLIDQGFEVGLHGTIASSENKESMLQQFAELSQASSTAPVGIRQHFLRFNHPQTFRIQHETGLKYDTSLGFAEYDGYRNGYCYPFKPYDLERNEVIDIWEIPLVMMEVSVLNYRGVDFEELRRAAIHLISEATKFGGIFSLLWHNCRLDESQYPGVVDFYESLLHEITDLKPDSITGATLIGRITGDPKAATT
jgi:hypothetical protein